MYRPDVVEFNEKGAVHRRFICLALKLSDLHLEDDGCFGECAREMREISLILYEGVCFDG